MHKSPSSRFQKKSAKLKLFKRKWIEKHGMFCILCAEPVKKLTFDHIIPVSKGGALYDIANLMLICERCNRKKGSLCGESLDVRIWKSNGKKKTFYKLVKLYQHKVRVESKNQAA